MATRSSNPEIGTDSHPVADVRSLDIRASNRANSNQITGCFAGEIYYSKAPDRFRKASICALAKLGSFRIGTDLKQAQAAQSDAASGATDPGLDVIDARLSP